MTNPTQANLNPKELTKEEQERKFMDNVETGIFAGIAASIAVIASGTSPAFLAALGFGVIGGTLFPPLIAAGVLVALGTAAFAIGPVLPGVSTIVDGLTAVKNTCINGFGRLLSFLKSNDDVTSKQVEEQVKNSTLAMTKGLSDGKDVDTQLESVEESFQVSLPSELVDFTQKEGKKPLFDDNALASDDIDNMSDVTMDSAFAGII